jgi:xanthine dehydrogenase accessory factor
VKRETLAAILAHRRENRSLALLTHLETGRQELIDPSEPPPDLEVEQLEQVRIALRRDRSEAIDWRDEPHFLQVFNPPLRLAVVGAVHIAQPLAAMASLAGFSVFLIDPRTAFATEARFPGIEVSTEWPDAALAALRPDHRTAVVTLTHDPKLDDPALCGALRSDAFYIGSLGSKRTHSARLRRLAAEGFGPDDFARIHGPVGLPLGARSPAEIAVSILAQIVLTLREPGS